MGFKFGIACQKQGNASWQTRECILTRGVCCSFQMEALPSWWLFLAFTNWGNCKLCFFFHGKGFLTRLLLCMEVDSNLWCAKNTKLLKRGIKVIASTRLKEKFYGFSSLATFLFVQVTFFPIEKKKGLEV